MQHPADTIKHIAEVADAFAAAAGVGGCETAGAIISYLAAHPDLVDRFMDDGSGLLMEIDARRIHLDGLLTWHRRDGSVISPAEARAAISSTPK